MDLGCGGPKHYKSVVQFLFSYSIYLLYVFFIDSIRKDPRVGLFEMCFLLFVMN